MILIKSIIFLIAATPYLKKIIIPIPDTFLGGNNGFEFLICYSFRKYKSPKIPRGGRKVVPVAYSLVKIHFYQEEMVSGAASYHITLTISGRPEFCLDTVY